MKVFISISKNCLTMAALSRGIIYFILFTLANSAFAAMQLSNAIVFFEPDKPPRQDITIYNPDKENLYVKVELIEVKNPGLPDEERIPVTNPEEISLIITPNKLLIPPNSHKSIRLVNVKPPGEKERVFRATVTPVTGEYTATQSGIKLMIAYGLLIFVQPENPKPELIVTRTGTKFHVKNIGNTNTVLTKGRQCLDLSKTSSDDNSNCHELPSKRIYAGGEWSQDLPMDAPVEYSLKTANKISIERYP